MRHPLLLHSVSYAGLWGQHTLSVDAFVEKAASLGYDGVMLMAKRPHVSPLDYDAAARAALRKSLESRNLAHNVLAGYCDLTAGLDKRDIPHAEVQLAYLDELVRLAADLGIATVRIFTGYEYPHASYGEQWNLVVKVLREASERAARSGITLGLQNHHDIAAGFEAFHDMIHAVGHPNCRALFDAWAPALHGADLAEAASLLGGHTIHTTIADYQKRPRYRYNAPLINYEEQTPAVVAVPMGKGFIDYRKFLGSLRAAGFAGSISYEMCSPIEGGGSEENLDRFARAFLEWAAPLR